MLSEWELWACARHQLLKHGELAPEAAAQRVDALLAAGDIDGQKVWLAILDRIRQLQGPAPGETAH
ncbi:hypothetical protein IP88_03985 [alpha proteobacterium AAP81b]|nr:hypothetical protein IP88_03985 [alpha proteobacterium AAP81b]